MEKCYNCNLDYYHNYKFCFICKCLVIKNAKLNSILKFIFSKAKIVINKVKIYRNSHKHLPNDDNPVKLKNIFFYTNHLIHNEKKVSYIDIIGITNKYSVKYVNNIRTELELIFKIHYLNINNGLIEIIDLSYSLEIWGWRKREITTIILNYLLDKTYESRLKIYLDEIKNSDFFEYLNFKISSSGDIYLNGKLQTNLYEENKKGNVWYGVNGRSITGRHKNENPYLLKIKNGIKDAGLFKKRDIDIDITYNRDIIDIFFKEIIEYNTVLTFNKN
ncbi:hypothetical protein ABF176_000701 [Flavobacterium psychrophilum]